MLLPREYICGMVAMSKSASFEIMGFLCISISAGPLQALRLPYVTKETRHGISRMRVLIKKKKKKKNIWRRLN